MTVTSRDSRYLVLHALRVKGLATDHVVGALSGLPADEVARQLATLAEDDLVRRREGRLAGCLLTPAGRQAHLSLLADEVGAPAVGAALGVAYEGFLPLNGDFKRICGSWQLHDATGLPNDHADADYDRAVVDRLAATHDRVAGLLGPLAGVLGRFGYYPPRLAAALDRVRGGDTAAFARPMADSYHDIWMELHQDLLLSLGRERSAHDEG